MNLDKLCFCIAWRSAYNAAMSYLLSENPERCMTGAREASRICATDAAINAASAHNSFHVMIPSPPA